MEKRSSQSCTVDVNGDGRSVLACAVLCCAVLCCHCGEFGWYGTLLFLAWGQEELASQGQKATAMASAMAGEGEDRMGGTSDDRFCIHLFIYSSSLAFDCLRNVSPSHQDHPPASTNSAERPGHHCP
jgi:hypothetical protein